MSSTPIPTGPAPTSDPLITLSPTSPTAPSIPTPSPSHTLPNPLQPSEVISTNGHAGPFQPVHIVLFVHGMWGDPLHLGAMSRRLQKQFPPRSPDSGLDSETAPAPLLEVFVATANRGNHTYDGVDWGAERVAGEFLDHIEQLERAGGGGEGEGDAGVRKKVTRCSIVGYSLGGLIARYVIGILEAQSFFTRVAPVAFYTFATPHIGLPRYPSFYSSLTSTLGPRWLSRTGEQFYAVDTWGTAAVPLLQIMAEPEAVFCRGLARFERRVLYANAAGDVTVPYVTSAIETSDPFFHHETNGIRISFDTKHPHLITKWDLPPPVPPKPAPPILSLEYVRSLVPTRPLLPPHLQFSYPYNYLFYALSPLLVPLLAPVLILAILYRFSNATRESRRRIALLEAEHPPQLARRPTLLSLSRSGTASPTSTVENGARSGAGTPAGASSASLTQTALKAATTLVPSGSDRARDDAAALTADADTDGPMPESNALAAAAGEQPMLTELQRGCAARLNGLGWEKNLVLIEGVRNSHGPIICRAPFQRQGEDVLDHFAEGFVL